MKKALQIIGGVILAIVAIALMIIGGAETIMEFIMDILGGFVDSCKDSDR